ncbi:MAG: Elongation factor Ts [Parcubacteria group bacterium GW2011_GWC1_43_11b]|uniref:Elongation factor Ts n=2 Tax=Candidatus Vogeliibacteriota TaxID=1817922 RepID=A0A1G2QFJ1_9BACT|nr:MAG: Elongation factor Ts [Parcubacteria group bacterium GW2011_GWC1_43_11b]OHA59183.1 MAG: translation elongation factor Ts [Candidatus Vogelbacteria bacterium RIFOXYB1_FULL_42_16]OHA60289.1 MAG: translation elongation factor Ts [Candidatus Vogelbacteria bacterium RIFOXYD1_FULL_42_15]
MVTTEQIKELRERTGISIAQCKIALEEAGGDMTKAMEALKAKGAAIAEKKSGREIKAGTMGSYVHNTGAIGVVVEVSAETDFVSKNQEFKTLADDIAMHIAACAPANVEELLAQEFIKDPSQTIDALVKSFIQKFGERIIISRFARLDTSDPR